jgi:hypothetical protein
MWRPRADHGRKHDTGEATRKVDAGNSTNQRRTPRWGTAAVVPRVPEHVPTEVKPMFLRGTQNVDFATLVTEAGRQPRVAQCKGRPGRPGSARSRADEEPVRLILDGTVIKSRPDRGARISQVWRPRAHAGTGRRSCHPSETWAGRARVRPYRPTGAIRPAPPDQPRPWRRSGGLRGRICGPGPPSPRRSRCPRPPAARMRDRRRRPGALAVHFQRVVHRFERGAAVACRVWS